MAEVPKLDGKAAARAAAEEAEAISRLENNGAPPVPEPEGEGDDKPQVIEAEYAFLVFHTPNGDTQATGDLTVPIRVKRPVSRDEIYGACAVVQKDLAIQEEAQLLVPAITQSVIGNLMQMQQKAMEAQQNQQVQQALAKGAVPPPGFGRKS